MQHRKRRRANPLERLPPVEVADDGHDAVRAQPGNVLRPSRESVESDFRTEQVGGAQRDVAAANQQYPDHHRAFRFRGPAPRGRPVDHTA